MAVGNCSFNSAAAGVEDDEQNCVLQIGGGQDATVTDAEGEGMRAR